MFVIEPAEVEKVLGWFETVGVTKWTRLDLSCPGEIMTPSSATKPHWSYDDGVPLQKEDVLVEETELVKVYARKGPHLAKAVKKTGEDSFWVWTSRGYEVRRVVSRTLLAEYEKNKIGEKITVDTRSTPGILR